jgi:hypothetical protein
LAIEKDLLEERVASLSQEVAELQGQTNTVSDLQVHCFCCVFNQVINFEHPGYQIGLRQASRWAGVKKSWFLVKINLS